ncbi:hypothetical protein F5884DRAFT_726164 [Xylogone sp. PMI_703]|nr:hypothetical protein F5884DRAFT_726164 [Xylogone sp. PMI_703]
MLLTSSQVSVAITTTIVFMCTTALFFSGYALQQKTVRDIRAAIKPAPRQTHHVYGYLPKRFDVDGDGSVPEDEDIPNGRENNENADSVLIEISETRQDKDLKHRSKNTRDDTSPKAKKPGQKSKASKVREPEKGSAMDDVKNVQKPMGAVDDRFVIPEPQKQPELNPNPDSKPNNVDPELKEAKPRKPLSRADRRKKIKEDLMALYEKDSKVYSPRMW